MNKKPRLLPRLIFLVYLCIMAYLLFLAPSMNRTVGDGRYHYNLELFREINRFINYAEYFSWEQLAVNLIGNVVAFMPFGFLLPLIRKKTVTLWPAMACTFLFSFMVESMQLVTKVGRFDVDDILLNTIGGVLGYLICRHWYLDKRESGHHF